jgi:hypothetical protein
MNGDMLASVIWIGAAMALVGSGLARRRIGMRTGLGLVLFWAGIFAAAFGIVRILTGLH